MSILISFILVTIVVMASIWFIYRLSKKSETLIEKVFCWILLLISYTPLTIYYLDRFNIFNKLGFFNGVNESQWFDFMSQYVSSIIGSAISSVIIVLITLKQIYSQNDNIREDKRIQNAPIFDYSLSNEIPNNILFYHDVILKENGQPFALLFTIENIGLNHSRNIRIQIEVDNEKDTMFSIKEYKSFIKKDDRFNITLCFNFNKKRSKNRHLIIRVLYNDFMNNEYSQTINADLFINDANVLGITNFNVDGEKLISEDK